MNFLRFVVFINILFSGFVFSQSLEQLESKLTTLSTSEKLPVLKQIAEIHSKSNNKLDEAYTNMDIGDLLAKQNQLDPAISYYKKSLKNFEILKDNKACVVVLNRIGSNYSKYGDYETAYTFFSKALVIANKSNLTKEAEVVSKNIEAVNKNRKNIEKTKTEFVQKKEIETLNIISTLVNDNEKSHEEISKLSVEAQLQELKIKSQEAEIERKKTEAENQRKINEHLKKEKELELLAAQEKLNKQQILIYAISGFALLLALLAIVIYRGYKQKKRANLLLAQKNEAISLQKDEIEKKSKVIFESIEYAKNIQQALLPSDQEMKALFKNYFVLYKPKDVVSGDFFWLSVNKDSVIFAVADCTGHGVPGAFVSMMGHAYLNEIININKTPSIILDLLNEKILSELNRKNVSTIKYGMDIAILSINKSTFRLEYAGAHNSLQIVRNTERLAFESDVRGVGTERDGPFENHSFQLSQNDLIYLHTDGFSDQRGGVSNKKFLSKRLYQLFESVAVLPMSEQKIILEDTIEKWKGTNDQMDDMLVVGIKM